MPGIARPGRSAQSAVQGTFSGRTGPAGGDGAAPAGPARSLLPADPGSGCASRQPLSTLDPHAGQTGPSGPTRGPRRASPWPGFRGFAGRDRDPPGGGRAAGSRRDGLQDHHVSVGPHDPFPDWPRSERVWRADHQQADPPAGPWTTPEARAGLARADLSDQRARPGWRVSCPSMDSAVLGWPRGGRCPGGSSSRRSCRTGRRPGRGQQIPRWQAQQVGRVSWTPRHGRPSSRAGPSLVVLSGAQVGAPDLAQASIWTRWRVAILVVTLLHRSPASPERALDQEQGARARG